MKPAAFLEFAEQAGVILSIGSVGKIKAKGGAEQVDRFAPLIREHKPELLAFLQSGSARPLYDEGKLSHQRVSDRKPTRSIRRSGQAEKMSPRAVAWLAEHRTALKAAGWTAKELYRRNRVPGLGWSRLWKKDDLEVVFEPSGRIVFTFSNSVGDQIKQTDIPQSVLWKRSK
ncbi:hypothetical protein GMJAKD_02620 [Candidatus Electrothrix aarhusensis]